MADKSDHTLPLFFDFEDESEGKTRTVLDSKKVQKRKQIRSSDLNKYNFIVMDISEKCQICKQSSDQMLMLACIHDPCINCAASAYAELVHIKNNDPMTYICELCGQETALDQSTIAELNVLSKSYVKVPSPVRGIKSHAVGSSTKVETSPVEQKSTVIPNKGPYFCKVHSEEELTYFCFTCNENICPQCAIHGSHKDHEVKLIKKAINEAKSQFIDITSEIGSTQNNMNKFREGFKKAIREAEDRNSREKQLVSQQFQSVRNALSIKERDILRHLDLIHKQNVSVLTGFVSNVGNLYSEIEKTRKEVENILKRSDVLILQDYKQIPSYEVKIKQLKKNSEEISGENCCLNSEFLQQELKVIQELIHKVNPESRKEQQGSLLLTGRVEKPS